LPADGGKEGGGREKEEEGQVKGEEGGGGGSRVFSHSRARGKRRGRKKILEREEGEDRSSFIFPPCGRPAEGKGKKGKLPAAKRRKRGRRGGIERFFGILFYP